MTQSAPSPGTGVWTLISGSATITTPGSPTTTVTGVAAGTSATVRWTVTNGTCSAFDEVTVTNDAQPVAEAGSGGNECDLTFVLSAVPTVGTGVWTQTAGPGTSGFAPNANTATATVTVTLYGTYTFRWTETNGTCSSFDELEVNFYEQPVVSNQANQTQCNTSTFTMTQSSPSVGDGVWTLISGSASITTPTSPTTTVTGVAAGTSATVRWTVTNGTCSAFDEVTVTNDIQPTVSNQPNQTLCNTSTFTMTQSAPSPGTGVWTLISGSATITTPGSPTTTVTGVAAGTSATVRWTVTNGTCSAFDEVTVTNDAQPVAEAGSGGNECDLTFVLSAVPTVGTGVWTQTAGPGTSGFAPNANTATATVTVTLYGTYTFRWTETNGTCSSFDELEVNFYEQPVVSNQANQTQCNTSTFTMTQSSPSVGDGVWTLISGSASITTPTSPTTTVTGVAAGTSATVRWTVTNGTCSAFDEVTVTNDIQPTVSNQPNQTLCNTSTFTMTQSAPSPGTGVWTLISGSATITTPGSPTTTVTGVAAGTSATVRWTVTNGTCSAFDEVTVTNDAQPVAEAGSGGNECDLTFVLSAVPTVGTGVWTQTAGPGTSGFAPNANTATATVTVTLYGTYTFRWTETNGTCSSFDEVEVNFYEQPVVSNQPNQTQCNTSTFTMTQSSPSPGTGVWTLISGSASITTPTSPTTTVTGVAAGTSATVRWTVTNGTCSAFDEVTVTNDIQPTVSNQPNQTLCNTSTFTMTQSAPSPGTGVWTLISGSATITTPGSPTTTITGVAAGTSATVRWTVTNGTCSAFDEVSVTSDAQPVAEAGSGGNECDLNYTLSAVPSVGTGTWTSSGPGTATFTPDANTATATVTVSAYGTYTFTWTEVNGTCTDDDAASVNFYQQPVANAGSDGNECDLNYTLSAVPSVGTGTWTSSGPGTATFTPDANTATATVTVSAYGTYTFTWTEVNGTCTDDDAASVNFYQQPVANAGSDGNECDLNYTLSAVPP